MSEEPGRGASPSSPYSRVSSLVPEEVRETLNARRFLGIPPIAVALCVKMFNRESVMFRA